MKSKVIFLTLWAALVAVLWAAPLDTRIQHQNAAGTGLTFTVLADPNADRVLGWDDSEGTYAWVEAGGSGGVLWNAIGDADADGTIALGAFETDWTSTLDSAGKAIWTITNTDADTAADTSFFDLKHYDGADANVFYMRMIGDSDGTPVTNYSFSQAAFNISAGVTTTFLGPVLMNGPAIRDENGLGVLETESAASAVNYFKMRNSATGDPVELISGGTDTDIDIALTPKGAGVIVLDAATFVPTEVYDATDWNGDLSVPTKDAVRDKLETMGGGITGAYEDVASATTTDIGAATSYHVNITGTTTITGLGTVAAGTEKAGKFAGALTLTYNGTSFILPGAANITTAAGDTFRAVSAGSGNWRVTEYLRADGTPLKLNALYGSDGTTRLNVSYTAQAAGTAINFGTSGTRALLDFTAGTPTDPTITIAAGGFYKIRAQVQVDYSGATITSQTMTLAVRRTNNTAADVSGVVTITLTPASNLTYTYGTVMIPEFEYTATAGDILSIYGTLSGATGGGNITCVAGGTAITGVRLYE